MGKMTVSDEKKDKSWQRRMGVEPTGDRAERPPSRFEDGETHRDLYTSMFAPFAYIFNMCEWV